MSPVKRPSAVDGLRRAAAVPATATEIRQSLTDLPAEAPKRPKRQKPVRITVDLTPEAYRQLTDWTKETAADLGFVKLSIADVVRAMVGSLSVEEFEQEMRIALRNLKED